MNTDKTFFYNRGLTDYDKEPVPRAAIELFKVFHLDLDNAIKGYKSGSFIVPKPEGFIYLNTLEEVSDAYEKGELYVVEGTW